MKKLIFIFIFALAFTSYHQATSSKTSLETMIEADSGDLADNIFVREVLIDSGPDLKSLITYVAAWKTPGEIVLRFNRYVGDATIMILDEEGTPCFQCSTDGLPGTHEYLPIPAYAGYYTLLIENEKYIGSGEFEIE